MIIPVLAIVVSLCLLMAFALVALIVVNGRLRCSLAAWRAIEDSLRKDKRHAREELDISEAKAEGFANDVERMRRDYERASEQRDEAREELAVAREDRNRAKRAVVIIARVRNQYRDERDEAKKRSATNLERYESEATARHEAREECGKARKELERVRASLRESVDSDSQVSRELHIAEVKLEERATANSLLVAIGKESIKLKEERDEARTVLETANLAYDKARDDLAKVEDEREEAREELAVAREERTRASVASTRFLKERDAARKKQGAATAKCKRAVKCAMKARKGKCDLIRQRDRAVAARDLARTACGNMAKQVNQVTADTKQATEELAGVRGALSSARDDRDEARQALTKLQNAINHLNTRHYFNSDKPETH